MRIAVGQAGAGDLKAAHYAALNDADGEDWCDPFAEARYRQFMRRLPAGAASLLDLGCHDGAGGRVLRAALPNARIVAVDCTPRFLDALPDGIYDQAVLASADKIPLPDSSFDAILAGEVVEHLEEADVDPALDECARLLRPGGHLLMTTPNPGSLKLRLLGGSVLGGSHRSAHPAERLATRARRAGFAQCTFLGSGRATLVFGENLPLALYGSYLLIAGKPGPRGLGADPTSAARPEHARCDGTISW
jgi:SAM-dependent methyltransferase